MKRTAFSSHNELYVQYLKSENKHNMSVQHQHDTYEIYLQLSGKRYLFYDNTCYTLERGDLRLTKVHSMLINTICRQKKLRNVQAFLDLHEQDFLSQSLIDYLNELMNEKNITVAQVAKNSGIGEYVYKIFNGERNAKRDTLVAISFGMHLTFEETQLLLRIAKFAILDSRDRRDGIMIYALMHGLSIFECDDLLNNDNLITLV